MVVEPFDAEEPGVKKAALGLAAVEEVLAPAREEMPLVTPPREEVPLVTPPREEMPLVTPPSLAAGEGVPPCTPPPPSPGLELAANLERPRRILGAEEGGSLTRLVAS